MLNGASLGWIFIVHFTGGQVGTLTGKEKIRHRTEIPKMPVTSKRRRTMPKGFSPASFSRRNQNPSSS